MKNFLCIILLLIAIPASAMEVTLTWNANSEPDLAGYKIYTGLQSRTYGDPIDVGNVTEHTMTVSDGFNFFAVTAYDTEGLESEYSNEVFTPDGKPPVKPIITITITVSTQ